MDFYDEHSESKSAAIKALFWDPVQQCIQEFNAFAKVIDEFVDLEYADKTDTYRIKPETNDTLAKCWKNMLEFEKRAEQLHKKVRFLSTLMNEYKICILRLFLNRNLIQLNLIL